MPDPLNSNPTTPTSPGGGTPSPSPSPAPAAGASPAPSTASRPDWLDETLWDDKGVKLDALKPLLDERTALVTAKAERAKAVPAGPDGYKLELPEGALAKGLSFEFDEKSPLLAAARKTAHEMGLPQAEFSRLLGIYVQDRVAEEASLQEAVAAEKQKLGANANARVDAVHQFLGQLGEAKAGALKSMMFSALQIEAMEDLVRLASGQGAAPLNGKGREGGDGKSAVPSDEEWARMSTSAKMDFTRSAKAAGQR